jgi:hypothetical protein
MILQRIPENQRLTVPQMASVRSDGLSFMQCLMAAAGTIELVREFDRLYKTSLLERVPLNRMIDEATGKLDADMQEFLRFVWNNVFLTVPRVEK